MGHIEVGTKERSLSCRKLRPSTSENWELGQRLEHALWGLLLHGPCQSLWPGGTSMAHAQFIVPSCFLSKAWEQAGGQRL